MRKLTAVLCSGVFSLAIVFSWQIAALAADDPADACKLTIKHNKIRAKKLSKPKKVVLKITGGESFDIFGRIDLSPLTWQKVSFKSKKNLLKVKAIVPAGLEPGIITVSVGDCFGEIEITGDGG